MLYLSILRYRYRIEWPADSKRHDSNCRCPRHVYLQEIDFSVHPAEFKYTVLFGDTLPSRPSRPNPAQKKPPPEYLPTFYQQLTIFRAYRASHMTGQIAYQGGCCIPAKKIVKTYLPGKPRRTNRVITGLRSSTVDFEITSSAEAIVLNALATHLG